jgi:copper oxidase (laccase) domain-containing protein
VTAWGTPALDLPGAVTAALRAGSVRSIEVVERCTACDADDFYSHRARREPERQVMVLWRSVAA